MPRGRTDTYEPEQTFYEMAYFVLPQYVTNNREKLISELSSGRLGALFFYTLTCLAGEKEPDTAAGSGFDVHAGTLDDRHDYYVVEYPTPRPVGIDLARVQSAEARAAFHRAVLAPYFSAVLAVRGTQELRYFILGQSPDGGTTLRTVTPAYNANLGRGSEPALEPFLQLLREKTAGGFTPVAAIGQGQRPPVQEGGAPMPGDLRRGARPPKRWWQFWK